MATALATAIGAALLGVNARLLAQEYRRVLAPSGASRSRGPLRLGFRELLYFRVVEQLSAEGLQLSPAQKRDVFRVFSRQADPSPGDWSWQRGQLHKAGAVPVTLDLSRVTREIRDRYRLFKRPQALVETNPALCSGQPVFRRTRIPVAVVVEQLRSGVCRSELAVDFPQLSPATLDSAEIQASLPRPQGRPRKALNLQRA
ncbi:MAG: DUF433 domain-containing protein [Cyanobium sp.]